MDVLTTRALNFTDETGNKKPLLLTVFMPYEVQEWQWKCGFVTDPPIYPKIIYGVGIDFLWAVVECLRRARHHFEIIEPSWRIHWQEMPGCGFPKFEEERALPGLKDISPPLLIEGSKTVLATRPMGYRDENGVEIERRLTVFMPSKAEGDVWTCGFTIDPLTGASIHYGVGADLIEAFLDALAKVRTICERMTSKGFEPLEESINWEDLPYKIGRSFWITVNRESSPDAPDAPAG